MSYTTVAILGYGIILHDEEACKRIEEHEPEAKPWIDEKCVMTPINYGAFIYLRDFACTSYDYKDVDLTGGVSDNTLYLPPDADAIIKDFCEKHGFPFEQPKWRLTCWLVS